MCSDGNQDHNETVGNGGMHKDGITRTMASTFLI